MSGITGYLTLTFLFALASYWAGLILSFYASGVPSGPAIILVSGVIFFISVLFAPQGLGFTCAAAVHHPNDARVGWSYH